MTPERELAEKIVFSIIQQTGGSGNISFIADKIEPYIKAFKDAEIAKFKAEVVGG